MRKLKAKIKNILRKEVIVNINQSTYERFHNKVALVFGGTSGIGLKIAEILNSEGATVIVCGRNAINIEGIDYIQFDFNQEGDFFEHLEKLIFRIDKKYGRIDIVVNSQGVLTDTDFVQDFLNVKVLDFEKTFKINLESIFFITQIYCKLNINKNIGGRVLNIVSTEGLKGTIVPYGISKAALNSFTKGVGKAMSKYGIIINGIAPGATHTKMLRKTNDDLSCEYIPSGRMCTTDEVASLAAYMLSDVAMQMIGEVVVLDGGESLK